MPDLKDLFKNFSFVSECCNGGNTNDVDETEIFRRIRNLELDYDRCIKHQAEVRAIIAALVNTLENVQNVQNNEKEPLLNPRAGDACP